LSLRMVLGRMVVGGRAWRYIFPASIQLSSFIQPVQLVGAALGNGCIFWLTSVS